MKLLVSNVGSTSLKFKLFDMPEERVLCEAKIERVGSCDAAIMSYRSHLSGARFSAEGLCIPSYAEGIALFLEKLTGGETGVIKGVERHRLQDRAFPRLLRRTRADGRGHGEHARIPLHRAGA